ncbi:mucin-2 [Amphiprion ocellaris]|uniref:Proline rich 33 n=1 Tax=Amphiprion ocellaris TaxID=80972 RepID=A0A3Q1CQJ9_AMPOC|nr:mucin-2 [Amphiprion ocellaris]
MAVAYGTANQPGLLSQQYPPPLLPKPGKDNVRLQKLLKRTAKRKASAQASQSAAPFRSSLSPVNEASPDLEHSDHSTPPKTPETTPSLYSIQQPPRFTVRPLYQHVASPYPQRAAFGRVAGMSPQTVEIPSYSYSQDVTTVSSYSVSTQLSGVSGAVGQVTQPAVLKISLPASSVSEATVPAAELKKPAVSTFAEAHAGLKPAAAIATPLSIPTSPSLTPYPMAGGQPMTRPLTVLTPLVKSKSPRPTFKATEPSRSPKPMFDVPQIRMYTATTSYYETSRTPPVYDTAGLTAIGSMVPQSKTDFTPASEVRRGTSPTTHPSLLGTDLQRKTTSSDTERDNAPTAEVNITPTSEIKRATPPAEIKRATPTSEIKRGTPTSEIKRATPPSEIKRGTPTSEIKRATPTSEVTVKTPIFEFQISRTSAGRPKTPAYHVTRATTPVFEISRPNPLLFAVSPITVQPERSRTPQTLPAATSLPASRSLKTTEPPEAMLNGDIHTDMTSAAKPTQQNITKSKSENDLTKGMIQTSPVGSQRPKSPTAVAVTTAVTGYQRPKTPTYEASRLMTTSPGYKRPKTPTYGASPLGVSPVAFQRPKTPTQVSQKSAYRGLTPAEYAAHGGIKTFSPAFGIISSVPPTQEEVKTKEEVLGVSKTPSQEPTVKGQSSVDVSTVKETPKGVDKPHQRDEKIAVTPSIPKIVVSQASDSSGTMLSKETSSTPGKVAKKQATTLINEIPKAKSPTAEGNISEKHKVETAVQETKPKTKTPETKRPLPKGADQDPLKAVKKLLGKDKVQTPEQKAIPDTKAVSEPQDPMKAIDATKIKPEDSKTSIAVPIKDTASESGIKNKMEDEKVESASAVKSSLETKEANKTMPEVKPLLEVIQKPKGVKSKVSGWSRLKKHMVVEQEEPQFPEINSQKEVTVQDQTEMKKLDEKVEDKAKDKPAVQGENQTKDTPVATKMWDAVLFQMFSSKENIMHQIELNKSEEEKLEETKELKEIPSFAYRLPVLLFSPKFDAKKLKEAASRPVTKISTVFEMGLIGRKGKEEEPKDFNRTARGFTAT